VTYVPPTLVALRSSVAADLRDPAFKTFTEPEVTALINGAVVEVSRAYPKEVIDTVDFVTGTGSYATDFEDVFRCEVWRNSAYYLTIPSNESDDSAQGGFDLFAGQIHLPWAVIAGMNTTSDDTIRLWGYQPRELFASDGDSLDGNADVEHAVRVHSVLTGYQRLASSRALFQQWTQDGTNTDVSPTQLLSMAQTYESQWQRIRQQLRTLRRR
jgi:hypothetical protein